MNSEHPENISAPRVSTGDQPSEVTQVGEAVAPRGASDAGARRPAIAVARGEMVVEKKVSEAKAKMRSHLPALDDDGDVGVKKEQVVVRDGKADLAFTGTLVASAAPSSAVNGIWKEYRVYETSAGKHVFSKITRRVLAEAHDDHAAEVFDPTPSSMPEQLLRSAHELTHSGPKTWTDEAVHFFGFDPLAKALYRKLGGQFEEHIS